MTRRNLYSAAAAIVLLAASQAAGGIDSSVAYSTTPPSSGIGAGVDPTMPVSGQQGLVRVPNPIDRSGNLVITGQVRGGRYFQGIVPYSAADNFSGSSPSSYLDSFIRDSTGVEDIEQYGGTLRPYYSASRTVSGTQPGLSGVTRPPAGANIAGIGSGSFEISDVPASFLSDYGSFSGYRSNRPLARSPQELEKILSFEMPREYTALQRPRQTLQLQDEQTLEAVGAALQQAQSESPKAAPLDTGASLYPGAAEQELLQPFAARPGGPAQLPGDVQQADERYRKDEELQRILEQLSASRQSQTPGGQDKLQPAGEQVSSEAGGSAPDSRRSAIAWLGGLSQQEISDRAKSIVGEHTNLQSYSEHKYNSHMRAAQEFLKQGKYYRAADAYTLALIYKHDDALACAGKAHALFAAGEYMSSALFLSRALQADPGYAGLKIDLVAVLADRDVIENRIANMEQIVKKFDIPEIKFLLAYVYYRLERPAPAKSWIESASQAMDQSQAVKILKQAIETPAGTN